MFLSEEDIFSLTGYKQTSAQLKWLRNNKFKFVLGGDGKPRVLKSHIEEILGCNKQQKRYEPDFQALNAWQGLN